MHVYHGVRILFQPTVQIEADQSSFGLIFPPQTLAVITCFPMHQQGHLVSTMEIRGASIEQQGKNYLISLEGSDGKPLLLFVFPVGVVREVTDLNGKRIDLIPLRAPTDECVMQSFHRT